MALNTGVYAIICCSSGHFYIGSTGAAEGFSRRERDHFRKLRFKRHGNPRLQNAYNKYGKENFSFHILECADRGSTLALEDDYLLAHFGQSYCYNIRRSATAPPYGPNGKKMPDHVRAHLDVVNKNRVISPETRAKIGAASRGRKATPETKAKLSAAGKGRKRSPESCAKTGASKKGKPLSAEHRAKLCVAWLTRPPLSKESRAKIGRGNTGKIFTPERRARIAAAVSRPTTLKSPTGEIVAEPGQRHFVRKYGLTRSGVSTLVLGKITNHRGWTLP